MRGWRGLAAAAAFLMVSGVVLAALLEFLAPDLSYQLKDRAREWTSGRRGRTLRMATGSATGSSHRLGTVLNKQLKARHGYELELVVTASPGNVGAVTDRGQQIDLAIINSADEDAFDAPGVYGLAALESQYFFVIVPNNSPVREIRDLAGTVNPGVRQPNQPPTLGERVLDYYGLTGGAQPGADRVTIVRPKDGNVADFAAGRMVAATRTQAFHSELIEAIFAGGGHRLVPIRDREALARAIPGARPAFIPAGLYGPGRTIPPEPVPTIAVTELMIARDDLPGRVAHDILEALFDPRVAREMQYDLTEDAGSKVGGLRLHPAAEIYYHRNDLPTSDRLGRISFVASGIAALAAGLQFVVRLRRNEQVKSRKRTLEIELNRLLDVRTRLESCRDPNEAAELIQQADAVLWRAEQDAAVGLLDAAGIDSLRSVHHACWRAHERPGAQPVGG